MNRPFPRLVLASGSPRRRRLLEDLGIDFAVRPVDVDESMLPGEEPCEHVERLARVKARAGVGAGELALGADTVVVMDGEILGKPADSRDAQSMLRRLAGRRHMVFSGVALTESEDSTAATGVECSEVELAELTEDEIRWYVATGEPLDKAGSYAIQGLGGLFVNAVFGNYSNVVGLPLPLTRSLFQQLGYDLLRFRGAQEG